MPSIKSAVKYGYDTFKQNWKLSVLATLITFLVQHIGSIPSKSSLLTAMLVLVSIVGGIIVQIGYTKIFLRVHDGEKPEVMDIWNEYALFWKFIGLSVLNGLIILVGSIFFIIPGLILSIRLTFGYFVLIDTKAGIIDSLKESWNITKGSFWKLFWFELLIAIITLLGLLALGIGMLITVPISILSTVYVYRALSRAKAGLTIPPTTEPETSPQIS